MSIIVKQCQVPSKYLDRILCSPFDPEVLSEFSELSQWIELSKEWFICWVFEWFLELVKFSSACVHEVEKSHHFCYFKINVTYHRSEIYLLWIHFWYSSVLFHMYLMTLFMKTGESDSSFRLYDSWNYSEKGCQLIPSCEILSEEMFSYCLFRFSWISFLSHFFQEFKLSYLSSYWSENQ